FRWAVGGDAEGLVWRLRSWLAPTAPGGLGLTVRPYYEGLPISRLDEGRTNGGESCRDQGERNAPRPVTEERCRGQKSPQVERREARRPASSAGDPGRSGDRPDRKAGHGVRRFRTQRLSALRPPRGGTQHDGAPRAAKNRGGGALAFSEDKRSDDGRRQHERSNPGPLSPRQAEPACRCAH